MKWIVNSIPCELDDVNGGFTFINEDDEQFCYPSLGLLPGNVTFIMLAGAERVSKEKYSSEPFIACAELGLIDMYGRLDDDNTLIPLIEEGLLTIYQADGGNLDHANLRLAKTLKMIGIEQMERGSTMLLNCPGANDGQRKAAQNLLDLAKSMRLDIVKQRLG
jgi:hypothetical protein